MMLLAPSYVNAPHVWFDMCHGPQVHRTQMQGQFRVKMFSYNKQQVEDLQTEQMKEAVKLLSTLLNNYGWGECSYESYKTNLSPRQEENTNAMKG